MEPTLENWISRLLNRLDRERFSEISLLMEPGVLIPVGILKEMKPKVLDFAASYPNSFLDAALLYYAKFIQSIEIVDLSSKSSLIPHYLKTIKILKNLSDAEELAVNLEPYLTIIIDGIKEVLLSFESIEKTFELLKILKQIEENFGFLIQKEEFEFVDIAIQEYVENELDLKRSHSVITKIKEGWKFDLFYSEGSWISKARKRLKEENKETCDKNLIKDILTLLSLFQNEYYPESKEEIIHYCEGFQIDSTEIFNSVPPNYQISDFLNEASSLSADFSPIFESCLISCRYHFKLKKRPISKMHDHITIWEGRCLFNLQSICIKEYKGNSQIVIDQYNNEATIMQNLSEIGSPLFLEYYSHFKDDDSYYIVMEFCEIDLSELMSRKVKFSRYDLAHFTYIFIKGLSLLKNNAHIYHRDIKPANIMIGSDNEFKLIDFNISQKFEIDSIQASSCKSSMVGTYEYSSPEVKKCLRQGIITEYKQELNDVYSLGLVILEMYSLENIVRIRVNDEEAFSNMLEEKINEIEIQWLFNLLKMMLAYDWVNRERFGDLLAIIEQDEEFMHDIKEYNNHKRAKYWEF